MKGLSAYRDPLLAREYLDEIARTVTRPWNLMEICGGQTHSLVRNGIIELLPEEITMIHGPGCPVCVTSVGMIDEAIDLAGRRDVILCSFGDMLRVPGSQMSLLEARAAGADVRVVYSALDAVQLAVNNPGKEIVFFEVGFETTAPANALSVVQADKLGVKNYSILTSHVLVPPAMEALLSDPENVIDGFLAAGHVCTIMGLDEYYPIGDTFRIPVVVTGFEPVDLLQGILMVVRQLEEGRFELENQYSRVVREQGNEMARETLRNVFTTGDQDWRGIGVIPDSGYQLQENFARFDARKKFKLESKPGKADPRCIAGDILKGRKKPMECPAFGKECTPLHPLGAPMVSSEGACAAYYHFSTTMESLSSVDIEL